MATDWLKGFEIALASRNAMSLSALFHDDAYCRRVEGPLWTIGWVTIRLRGMTARKPYPFEVSDDDCALPDPSA